MSGLVAPSTPIGVMIFLCFPFLHLSWTPVHRSAWGTAGASTYRKVTPVGCQVRSPAIGHGHRLWRCTHSVKCKRRRRKTPRSAGFLLKPLALFSTLADALHPPLPPGSSRVTHSTLPSREPVRVTWSSGGVQDLEWTALQPPPLPHPKLVKKSQQIAEHIGAPPKQLATDLDLGCRPQTHLPFGCGAVGGRPSPCPLPHARLDSAHTACRSMNGLETSFCPTCRAPHTYFPAICGVLDAWLRASFPDQYLIRCAPAPPVQVGGKGPCRSVKVPVGGPQEEHDDRLAVLGLPLEGGSNLPIKPPPPSPGSFDR